MIFETAVHKRQRRALLKPGPAAQEMPSSCEWSAESANLRALDRLWRIRPDYQVNAFVTCALILLALVTFACKREERGFRVQPPAAERINSQSLSELQPGPPPPNQNIKNDYEENAYALSEGKRLFSQYNCNGCHAQGGGGMGPALMDDKWIYGARPEQVFSTIVEGRPNGMPSFRGRVPDFQVWQLAAYVRSMTGHSPKDAAPARDDHMQGKPPEAQTKPQPAKMVSKPTQ